MTITFDAESLPALQEQRIQHPWRKKTPVFTWSVVLATLIPLVIVGALFIWGDIPGALLMTVVYLPLQLIASGFAAFATRGKRGILDSVIIVNAIGATIFSLVILISVIGSLIVRGFSALSAHFIYQNNVYVSPSTPLEYGGIGHAILGTLLIVGISALIAVPIGIATAIYITEVRGRAVPYVRFFVQAMSGVPSVVAGLFVLTIIVATGAFEQGAFAGGLAYAILMLPTVARTAEEVLKLVPDDLRTGALALGSTRARTVFRVVLPAARTGIITAIILGVARVIGETAPLLLASGYADSTIVNPFGGPIAAVPTYIFNNVALPYPDAVARAWASALVLIVLVGILFVIARVVGRGRLSSK
ncbi:MAG: phosphate ABC transporter permease PstA [Candidatus Nanopelagicales bacterium]|nr:phosphate ABC transporter permease PstA [Candidatus Nanopelagicales bacterium]MCF8536837.1 phosphate ABC transporter permease PstA [Candidatus Nanopelagicales bacterium]MCF8541682.1 phosphate ABC transporter permease PstA [Candidatus Nanopelagicales bacterium]MCF8556134.1 phosphate ABC transporter permease PstA [Candidatus Nanopelagicales bacterium]